VTFLPKNPELKYSVERLLNEANPEGEPFFGGTAFNKMIFLLYKDLKNQDIDIRLPFYWYLQGSLIEENQFEADVGHPRQYYITSDRSSRRMMTVPKTNIQESDKNIIDEGILRLVQGYRQSNGYFKKGYVGLLLDDVYEKAPYEFQRTFNRKLIPFLNSIKPADEKKIPATFSFEDEQLEKIDACLDASIKAFPDEDMERIYTTYMEWDDTVRIALEYDQKRTFPMTDSIWGFFCKNLRIIKNENIPDVLIHHWETQYIESVIPSFQSQLHKLRLSLLKKWKGGQEEDKEIDGLVQKLNLISRNHLQRSET
jgi:hypothetical protein